MDSSWRRLAIAATDNPALKRAAEISEAYDNSPQCIDFDTLGRPFCTTDDNTVHGMVVTHNTLDITGRPIALTDAKGRVATTRIFALGEKHLLSVQNIDSGRRRMLNDVAGKPVYQWDSRGHKIHYTYDELQRPVSEIVDNGQQVFLAVKNVYGSLAEHNNIGRIYQVYDQSGLTEFSSYDFKGNPLVQVKQFCQSYNAPINWAAVSAPLFQKKYNDNNEDEVFTTTWTYNALNQPLLITLPDGSSQQNTYNKAGLLETVSSNGQAYVSNINYNEKGQRSDIHYGNGCMTRYEYDKNTFRLIRLLTTRNTGRDILQDILYTYDPVGNIVEIVDNAQQYHYFSNSVIEPRAMYKYDALYRLIEATGREKSGLTNAFSNTDMGIDFPIPHNGANSMENYTHFYAYDKLGNIMSMNSQGKWLRNYVYAPGSNLLLKHDSQQTIDDYAYDAHGNITRMPGIEDMQWNYADYLSKTQCGTVNTWYVYDQSGNRSRKITEKQGGIREERIYLGSYELYRKYQGAELVIERSTVHIMDDKSRVAIVDRQTVENGNTVSGTVNYRYQLSNHLGSATIELDQTAQIISYEEYHPFGNTSYWSGQSESEVKKKRYRYVGKERDEETGLYYYGARYYAAWIGRFVSVDPFAHKRTWVSPYNYVQNNPITRIDSNGMLDGEPDEIPNEKIKVGNITFINQAVRDIKSKQSVIQAVEKNIENLKSNNSNNVDAISENNAQLKDLNKELNDLLESAREIDMMINEIILYNPMVSHLKHSSREEYFPGSNVGDKFDVLGAINECLDESKPLMINVSAGEIEENKSSLGATRVENLGDHYKAYITINLNKTMDSFATFANEIGDVYNRVNNELSEWEAEDIERTKKFHNQYPNKEAGGYPEAWDNFYRSLNATKISVYIEDLFKKARGSYKQLNGVK